MFSIKSAIPSKNKLSLSVLLIILLWFSIVPMTKKWGNPLTWDVFGYYLYVPATFIWNDVALKDFGKVEEANLKYENTDSYYQGSKTEEGNWMIKYSMGLAMLETPFFFVAHKLAPSLGYPADGFSRPYQLAMFFAHFFYLLIGFIFLRKVLLKLFSDKITAILLLLVVIGTNYYTMAMLVGVTPIHSLEFSLVSIFLFLTISFHENATKRKAVFLGIVYGLIILVRPSDILVGIIPLFWGVSSFKTLKEKITMIFKNQKLEIVLFGILLFVVLFPQLYYWKIVAGKWLLFSYNNNPGEGFEFLSPYLSEVLFGFRKGWLLYTPLMLFSSIGFVYLYKQKRELFFPIVLFFVLNVYLISSWSCYWYAGGFGQRAMVDSYPILLLPLGYYLNYLSSLANRLMKYLLIAIILLLVILNIFQTWQFEHRIIDATRMTSKYYFKTFGKTNVSEEDKKLMLVNRGESVFTDEENYTSKLLFSQNYNTPDEAQKNQYRDSLAKEGKYCFQMDSNTIYTSKYEASYSSITKKDYAWIRCTGWFYPTKEMKGNPLSLVVTFLNYQEKMYDYNAVDISKQTKDSVELNKWNKFTFDFLTPEVRSVNDKINIYFWYKAKAPILIDDLEIQVFEKKNK